MKLWIFLMLVLHLGVSAGGHAQQRISLNMSDVTLEQALKELKKQTGFRFFYSVDKVRKERKSEIKIKDLLLQDALGEVLRGTKLTFTIMNDVVVIKDVLRLATDSVTKMRRTIKGVVRDNTGAELPGVTVRIKGTTLGTATDTNGKFQIVLSDSSKIFLVFSFIGMKTLEKEYKGEAEMSVEMQEDVEALQDVIVTGYGNIVKGNYTGAATTIKAKDIMMAGASSIDQMLQGVVPGMLVQMGTGLVGGSPKIRVRGTSTLLGSQEPVWVVDGVIQQDPQPFNQEDNTKFSVDADDIRQLAGNAISWLDPNDIETITVLKDAAATAIYGSKAANGVIVITTKKAEIGKISVSYNGDYSVGQRPGYGLYDQMNSREAMTFSEEIYEERVSYPNPILPIGYAGLIQRLLNKEITVEEMNREYEKMARENTDWFKILFRNSFNHSHNVSISGGSEKILNRTSFSYKDEKGEAKGNNMSLFSVTSNTTVNWGERLTVNMLLKGSIRKVKGFAYGVDPFNYAYYTTRVIPAYHEDGSLFYHLKEGAMSPAIKNKKSYNYNILNELANTGSENRNRTWGATVDLKWRIIPGLEYQGLVSYTSSSSDSKKYATENSFYITQYRGYEYGTVESNGTETKSTPLPHGGKLETSLTNTSAITVRNALVYDRLLQDKHRVTLQLGIETNTTKTEGGNNARWGYLRGRGETFATPPTTYLYLGINQEDNSSYVNGSSKVVNKVDNKLSEYLSAVYTYDDCYVLNFSARLDASNRFGQDKNKRFEPTWSVGAKWRVTNERFASDLWWLNNLELYASYGYQGNAVSNVSPYLIASNGSLDSYYQSYVLNIKSLPYPNLGWEKTNTYNIGIEAAFLKGRLNFTANYFAKSSNVLSSRDVPYENGVGNAVVSGSTMENYGYDFVINVVPVQLKDFTWQLSLNTGVTRNKVKKNERVNTLNDYLNGKCVVNGEPYSTFYSYEFDKLDETDGTPLFKGMELEKVDDAIQYLVKSGKILPDFSGGLNTMFKYKNFSFYALFTVQWGGHKRLPALYPAAVVPGMGLPSPEQNVSRKLAKRWKKKGDDIYNNLPSLPGLGKTKILLPVTGSVTSGLAVNPYNQYDMSNIRVANTDFIRCRSLSLSYEFDREWLNRIYAQRMQLKVSMMNPFMWVSDKKWEGLDPETGNWPTRRVTSLSLQLMF